MLSLFGTVPNRWRGRFPAALNAIVIDHEQASAERAFAEGVLRRERAEPFYGMTMIEHPRHEATNAIAEMILTQVPGYDRQIIAFQQLYEGTLKVGGKPAHELLNATPVFSSNAGDFLALSDELLVRSHAEYRDLMSSGLFPSKPFQRILLTAEIPRFERVAPKRPSVVVWTGLRPARDALLVLFGLREFRGDVTYVASEPLQFDLGARYMRPDDPELPEVLGRSAAVVCTDATDPADAVAFARTGIGVLSPVTAHAYEFAHGIVTWLPHDARSIYGAVAKALTLETAADPATYAIPLAPHTPEPPFEVKLPLVTIITPTYNRREYLRKMMTCLASQTYPHIESIVVNDAGEDVSDIVAEYPFARLITLETNRGPFGADEEALKVARGEYVALLPDDDWYYPNHIELLVRAILRSGAAVAHSSGMVRYLRANENGEPETYGFNTRSYQTTVNPTWAQVATPVAAHQCLQARRTFAPDDVGWYLNDHPLADQEYHMRLVERHQLAFVERFTTEFRDHPRNTGKDFDWAEGTEQLYRDIHPLADRPWVEARRRATIESLRNVPAGSNVHEPSVAYRRAD